MEDDFFNELEEIKFKYETFPEDIKKIQYQYEIHCNHQINV